MNWYTVVITESLHLVSHSFRSLQGTNPDKNALNLSSVLVLQYSPSQRFKGSEGGEEKKGRERKEGEPRGSSANQFNIALICGLK